MARKFSERETVRLVQLYRKHQCLWDINSPNHRDKVMRENALEDIASEIEIEGMTGVDVKLKMKSIRGTYYLELDKIEKARSEGNVYVPRLIWFEAFHSFIKDMTVKRRNTNNQQTQEDVVYLEVPTDNESDSVYNIDPIPSPQEAKFAPKMKRKRIASTEYHRDPTINLAQRSRAPVEINGSEWILASEENEFDIFGRHVASLMKKLSEEQAMIAQEQIQRVLTQARLADIRGNKIDKYE